LGEEYVCRNCYPARKFANLLQYLEHLREDSSLTNDYFFDWIGIPCKNDSKVDLGPIDPGLDEVYAMTLRSARRRRSLNKVGVAQTDDQQSDSKKDHDEMSET
jgi:hypothetical protein